MFMVITSESLWWDIRGEFAFRNTQSYSHYMPKVPGLHIEKCSFDMEKCVISILISKENTHLIENMVWRKAYRDGYVSCNFRNMILPEVPVSFSAAVTNSGIQSESPD